MAWPRSRPAGGDFPDGLRLRYQWRADLTRRLAGWLVPAPQQQRLRAYQEALADAMRRERRFPELPALLTPLFVLAQQRSEHVARRPDRAPQREQVAAERVQAFDALTIRVGDDLVLDLLEAIAKLLEQRKVAVDDGID